MNRFKKVTAIVLSVLVGTAPFAAFANEITDFDVDGNAILTVEGKLNKEVKGAYVNFYMRKDGKLVLVKQGETNKNGVYKFKIDMSEIPSGGVFSIKTTSQFKDEGAATETIEYYTDKELEGTYKDIFKNKTDSAYIAEKIGGEYKDKMVFTNEFFRDILKEENLSDIADFITEEINAEVTEDKIVDEVVRTLNITSAVKMLEYSKDAKTIAEIFTTEENLKLLGLKENKILAVYAKNIEADSAELDDEEAEKLKASRYALLADTIIELKNEHSDYADFVSDIENSILVADISRCRGNDSLRAMLEGYAESTDALDVSLLTEDALTEILVDLENDEITSIGQIQGIIDDNEDSDAVVPDDDDDDDDDNRGGGGRHNYSGGYVSVPNTTFDPTDLVKPEVAGFKDMAGFAWAKDSIDKMVSLGMLSGYSKDEFAPGDNVTRAQFAKMMCNVFGISEMPSDGSFTDVPSSEWYAGYVYALKNAGYINGLSENIFGSDEYISRQDVFTIVYRILKDKNFAKEEVTEAEFKDWAEVADYAKAALATLSKMELVKGDNGNIKPEDNMTRAEGAVVMHRIYEGVIQ